MRSAQARARTLRCKGPNMLYVAMLVLLHPGVFRKGLLVFLSLNDMAIFHGLQVQECETCEGCRAWYTRMSQGAFWRPVKRCWSLLLNLTHLSRAGFACTPDAALGLLEGHLPKDVPLVQDESMWVQWLLGLLCAMTRNRARHLLW